MPKRKADFQVLNGADLVYTNSNSETDFNTIQL